jgi:PhnB protein
MGTTMASSVEKCNIANFAMSDLVKIVGNRAPVSRDALNYASDSRDLRGVSMKLTPHVSLAFNGDCEAAFRFYEQCLDGTIAYLLTWGNSPMAADAPPGWEAKIAHVTLKVGDTVITGSDVPPGRYEQPKGFSLVIDIVDPAAAERVFQALAQNARIDMPLQQTFWASRFGVLVDQFGIPWAVNCE